MRATSALIFGLISAAVLSSCATTYKPEGFGGGYSEVQLNAETYKINIRGNGYTTPERAKNIALLRAADLTLTAGYQRFVILGENIQDRYAGTTGVTANRIGNTVYFDGGDTILKPSGDTIIRMVQPNDPAFATAYDASLIKAQLLPKLSN